MVNLPVSEPPNSLLDELKATGSSFYWAIRLLPVGRRTDLSILYLFCRAVDDIADGPLPPDDKAGALEQWRTLLTNPATLPHEPLAANVRDLLVRHPLLRSLLVEILDGVAMDLPPGLQAPDQATFTLYCRRVAGYVGMALVRLLGCNSPAIDRFALATGDALQFTNILRDVKADADCGRLYLPAPLLDHAGVTTHDPAQILLDPALPRACALLAAEAESRYQEALDLFHDPAISDRERRQLRPARVMLGSYRLLLRRLQQRGWQAEAIGNRTRLSAVRLLIEALRCYTPGS